jgi:hypothetical protein
MLAGGFKNPRDFGNIAVFVQAPAKDENEAVREPFSCGNLNTERAQACEEEKSFHKGRGGVKAQKVCARAAKFQTGIGFSTADTLPEAGRFIYRKFGLSRLLLGQAMESAKTQDKVHGMNPHHGPVLKQLAQDPKRTAVVGVIERRDNHRCI